MTNYLKKAKDHMYILFIIITYIVTFIISPRIGVNAVKNTGYYIKEMLMIMPVIFILTALLDTWVPKESIIKYLGTGSKTKGMLLSFVLGGISAGPIYAAFPVCIMLHKKGASIRNIVIILSSWAVIKIPMLLNEVKFLGLKFMIIRWILTVISIVIFSWIASKIVMDEDIRQNVDKNSLGITINRKACMGCSLCASSYNEIFEIKSRKAYVKKHDFDLDEKRLEEIIKNCPVKAIEYKK